MSDLSHITVGVHCSLEEATRRELERGDRRIGIAAHQFDKVHSNRVYDLEVDTGILTPEQAADTILNQIAEQGSAHQSTTRSESKF